MPQKTPQHIADQITTREQAIAVLRQQRFTMPRTSPLGLILEDAIEEQQAVCLVLQQEFQEAVMRELDARASQQERIGRSLAQMQEAVEALERTING